MGVFCLQGKYAKVYDFFLISHLTSHRWTYHVQLYDKDNGYIVIREDNLEILYLSMFWKIFSDNNTSRIIRIAAGNVDMLETG